MSDAAVVVAAARSSPGSRWRPRARLRRRRSSRRADELGGRSRRDPRRRRPRRGLNPNVFVHVAPDGPVTIVCHRSEMGQGVRSSLPVLIADELGADMARVTIVQADGDKKYGDQNTDGSTSMRKQSTRRCARAGATARMMLVAAAAKRWRRQAGELHDARTTRSSTRRRSATLGFGELVDGGREAARARSPRTSSCGRATS